MEEAVVTSACSAARERPVAQEKNKQCLMNTEKYASNHEIGKIIHLYFLCCPWSFAAKHL
jgi:hypothetical protein